MTTPECTACHGGADYRLDLRDAPTPYYYCNSCRGIFLSSFEKVENEEDRRRTMSEVKFTPIDEDS